MIQNGQFKTKVPEGTRNCMFCNKNVVEWTALQFERINELYSPHEPPAALCCLKCKERPAEELYRIFWVTIIMVEMAKYAQGDKTGIIKNEKQMDVWKEFAVKSGAVKEAQNYLKKMGRIT